MKMSTYQLHFPAVTSFVLDHNRESKVFLMETIHLIDNKKNHVMIFQPLNLSNASNFQRDKLILLSVFTNKLK